MLEIAPLEPEAYYRRWMRQTANFVTEAGAQDADFLIAPMGSALPAGRIVSLRYSSDQFVDGNFFADVTVATVGGEAAFTAGLRYALGFVQGVFGEPDGVERLAAFDPHAEVRSAAAALDLPDDLLTQAVGKGDDGYHIAPVTGGAQLYLMERGTVSPIAESRSPALLAYLAADGAHQMAANVAERSAESFDRLLAHERG